MGDSYRRIIFGLGVSQESNPMTCSQDYSFPVIAFPQVVWCHWEEVEPFFATLAQDGLTECDQLGKNPSKYSAIWLGIEPGLRRSRTDSEVD